MPGSIAAAVPAIPSALRATRMIVLTSGWRLISTAAARPMPWLAPVITHTLPVGHDRRPIRSW